MEEVTAKSGEWQREESHLHSMDTPSNVHCTQPHLRTPTHHCTTLPKPPVFPLYIRLRVPRTNGGALIRTFNPFPPPFVHTPRRIRVRVRGIQFGVRPHTRRRCFTNGVYTLGQPEIDYGYTQAIKRLFRSYERNNRRVVRNRGAAITISVVQTSRGIVLRRSDTKGLKHTVQIGEQ